MLRRFQCTNCGEHGWILSDEPTVALLRLKCASGSTSSRSPSGLRAKA